MRIAKKNGRIQIDFFCLIYNTAIFNIEKYVSIQNGGESERERRRIAGESERDRKEVGENNGQRKTEKQAEIQSESLKSAYSWSSSHLLFMAYFFSHVRYSFLISVVSAFTGLFVLTVSR